MVPSIEKLKAGADYIARQRQRPGYDQIVNRFAIYLDSLESRGDISSADRAWLQDIVDDPAADTAVWSLGRNERLSA